MDGNSTDHLLNRIGKPLGIAPPTGKDATHVMPQRFAWNVSIFAGHR
jgi:hypothetical protein